MRPERLRPCGLLQLDRGGGRAPLFVEGGRIQTRPAGDASPSVPSRLDCAFQDGVEILPGDVNAHTHLYSALAPLFQPAQPTWGFLEILQRIWWRLDRALDEASLRASARLYVAEALLAGTTTLVDHHESPAFIDGSLDLLADAAQELGVRLVVGYGATERNGGREEARRGLAECRRFVRDSRKSPRPLVRGVVALHASFTVSDESLREAGALARELDTIVHVHVAEDLADVEDARRRGHPGPLERLLAFDALPRGSILAHGVKLDLAQVRRAAEAGLWLVQNPRSNEGNRVGYPEALRASPKVALGTDGFPSDLALERAALARIGLAHGENEAALAARGVGGLGLAGERFARSLECSGPAASARRPAEPSSSLERSGPAAFAVFDPLLAEGAAADLVVRAPGELPRHVLVDGEIRVKDGRLVQGDLEEIRARAREEAPRLLRRMESLA